jgi:hypothetical protein
MKSKHDADNEALKTVASLFWSEIQKLGPTSSIRLTARLNHLGTMLELECIKWDGSKRFGRVSISPSLEQFNTDPNPRGVLRQLVTQTQDDLENSDD